MNTLRRIVTLVVGTAAALVPAAVAVADSSWKY